MREEQRARSPPSVALNPTLSEEERSGGDIPVMCSTDASLDALHVQDTTNLPTHLLQSVRLFILRLVCTTIAKEIRHNQAIAAVLEVGYLVAPIVTAGRETMEEK